jgi:hypothetical protein
LPIFNAGEQLLLGFRLIGLLKFIDLCHQGLHALEFPLVFRTNDFLESPLDHEILPASYYCREGSNIPFAREKQGGLFGKTARFPVAVILKGLIRNPRDFGDFTLF